MLTLPMVGSSLLRSRTVPHPDVLATECGRAVSWSTRPARPGETCRCGRPAVVVHRTHEVGDVPDCGGGDRRSRA